MEEDRKPEGFEEIEEAIRAEKDRAVDVFRRSDFLARLEAKSDRAGRAPGPKSLWIRSPALSLLACGALFLVLMIVISIMRKSSPAGKNIFETALGPIANLGKSAGPGAAPAAAPVEPDAGLRALRDSISRGFVSVQTEGESASAAPLSGRQAPRTPRLTSGERMDILFRQKVIRRGLTRYRETNKEVSKWIENSSVFAV